MIRNIAQTVYFEARNTSTQARVSGCTITSGIVKDGGALSSTSASPTEIGTTGCYQINLTAEETNCNTAVIILSTTATEVVLPLLTFEFVRDPSTVSETSDFMHLTLDEIANMSLEDIASLPEGELTTSDLLSIIQSIQTAISTLVEHPVPTASEVSEAVWEAEGRTLINQSEIDGAITLINSLCNGILTLTIDLSSSSLESLSQSLLTQDITAYDSSSGKYTLENLIRASLLSTVSNNKSAEGNTLTTLKLNGDSKSVFQCTTDRRGEPLTIS